MITHSLFPRQNGLSDESAFVYTAQFMCVYIYATLERAFSLSLSLSKLQSYSERIRARPEGRERNRFSPTS